MEDPLGDAGMRMLAEPQPEKTTHLAVVLLELEEQRERGDWSGAISTSGSPIYTLREIAAAVVREQEKVTQG
jgi:hypothetical protein